MSPTFEARYLLVLALVVAGIGTIDAALSRAWDLLAVLGILDALLAGLGLRVVGPRPAVRLRPDLVAWLRRRAAETGESLESVADRAAASYRDRLGPQAVGGERPESWRIPPVEAGHGPASEGRAARPETARGSQLQGHRASPESQTT